MSEEMLCRSNRFRSKKWRLFEILLMMVISSIFVWILVTYANSDTNLWREETNEIELYNVPESIKTRRKSLLECFANSVIAKNSAGRLGNHLMEYASAWSLARIHNLTLLMQNSTNKYISSLFYQLSAIPVHEFINEMKKRDEECANLNPQMLLNTSNTPLSPYSPENIQKWKLEGPIILRPYIVLSDTIAVLQSEMKEEFIYSKKLWDYSQKKLRKSSRILKLTRTDKPIVYVGVHVRRTDYSHYMHSRFGKEVAIVDEQYYMRAMNYMLKTLMDQGNFKVVFSVASDDSKWSTTKLIPALESNLKINNLDKNVTVVWNGSKSNKDDLVMLSACNHSIISYGTFGAWSALMSGGLTVVFDIDKNKKNGLSNSAMTLASKLPNWKIM